MTATECPAPPAGLRYSERKLWDECLQARPVLERLARYRLALRTLREAMDGEERFDA